MKKLTQIKERNIKLRNSIEQNKKWCKELKYALQCSQRQEETLMRRIRAGIIIINILVLLTIAVSGCKMVQGMGEDITWAGGAGEKFLEYRDK